MRISRLSLKNFRQFYGDCALEFRPSDTERITVIHGENGSGKTSLLNAFKWVLYGHTDFDTGEKTILNELALAETEPNGVAELSLELEFEHEGSKYTANRRQEYRRLDDSMDAEPIGQSVPKLVWIDPEGKFESSPNPGNQINQIIPEKMHSYFFFNGERIEKLANVSASGEIRDAIRTLMGLEIVERAADHLGRIVIKDFRKEASESASSEYRDLSDIEDRLGALKKDLDKVKSRSEKEDIARRRLEYAEECKRLIDSLHNALAEETRSHLSERVNETFQKILRKDFWAEIDKEYTLRIFKNLPNVGKQFVSEKSTGENQVISLSFIASLVSLAKERRKARGAFFKGGIYPIIMDSPFGALDPEYREKIADHIPQLADQIIVFASNSQWSSEVDTKCRPFIGREYSLVYHAPRNDSTASETPYVRFTDGPEFTQIEEGYLGR